MDCEVCGKREEGIFLAVIEGARMHACEDCARMGKILKYPQREIPKSSLQASSSSPSAPRATQTELELIDGFGSKMRNARMKMKLPLSVMAEKLAEKESFLERIENEKTHPSTLLAKKIEKELGIKLLEEVSSSILPPEIEGKLSASKGNTLGDILEIERKSKKK